MNNISIESLLLDYVKQHEGHIRRLIYSMFRYSGTVTLVLQYDRETNTVSSDIMQGDNCWYYPSERYYYYYVLEMTEFYKSQFHYTNRQGEYRKIGPHMKEYLDNIRSSIKGRY